ncbi:hypothetical protein ACF3DV_15570 [Chlorogloeopsis fritschii PCC 9212]|uniref:Uncharacterized protein n=1 Tax=Chlorogloeopsis fritschii PCC 6912 TaxID=211165 RepID=A0A433NKQ8_CHLFR|nr:hypothetical protein [Chlorogloeopsis fritschii]RUR83400.1 hypothetical protein PCC6912_22330 [Chlorogloeopsis fritschii PCC 6912]
MTNIESSNYKQKILGECLINAGLITSEQLTTALYEQIFTGKQLQEILIVHGWVEQQTIEFLMDNVVFPNLSIFDNKQFLKSEYEKQSNHFIKQNSQTKNRYTDLANTAFPLQKILVHLSPKKTLQFLIVLIVGLCLVSIAGQLTLYFLPDYSSREFFAFLFNVDEETNIPSLYSAYALLVCSILLFLIASAKKIAGEAYISHWKSLSFIFMALSLDEFMSFHERLIEPLQNSLNTSGFLYYAWVIPGTIFVLIFLLAFLRFITTLPTKIKRLFIIAGTIYVSGAIGMEMLGGYYTNLYGEKNIIYAILTTIEEFLEMLGIVIFIYALMSYISTYIKGISLNIIINHNQQTLNT